MASRTSKSGRLPSRFPVGTKFVIEGERLGEGQVQVFRRYIEFPDGTHLQLPARPDVLAKRKTASADHKRRRATTGLGQRPTSHA